LGINNARTKGLITSLAFQAALSSKSSGRDVSDADVKRFVEEIGGKSRDPETFATVLLDVSRRIDSQYRINHKVRMKGAEFTDDMGLTELEDLIKPQERTTAENPRLGELRRIRAEKGRWTPQEAREFLDLDDARRKGAK
jgi:hypothetical protein